MRLRLGWSADDTFYEPLTQRTLQYPPGQHLYLFTLFLSCVIIAAAIKDSTSVEMAVIFEILANKYSFICADEDYY